MILNPSLESSLMKDEVFGPIMPIITYKDFNEVVPFVNRFEKPLGVYYFGSNSSSNKNLQEVKTKTSSGAFLVNDIAYHVLNAYLPFSGVGHSGMGALHGHTGFLEMSNKKAVMMKPAMNIYPWTQQFPPHTADKVNFLLMYQKYGGISERSAIKRAILAIIILYILWMIVTKRLTVTKIRKFFKMASMLLKIMFTK